MYKTAATVALIGMFVVPLGAQGRGRNSQGIPPGQLPPAGQCRVWYEGVPPGRQPRATSCREAERIASRDRNARVIYGANTDRRNDGWWDPNENPRSTGRAIPRPSPYPPNSDRYPSTRYPNSRGTYRYANVAFDNGYNDGLDKGREDSRDRDSVRSESPQPLPVSGPRLREPLRVQGRLSPDLPRWVPGWIRRCVSRIESAARRSAISRGPSRGWGTGD